jgi:hypothetical protein
VPFSQNSQLTPILGWVEALQPASVLDVGAGMGKYGFLLRVSLEADHLFVVEGNRGWQRPRSDWRVVIDGVEGFGGYLTPVHDWAYNRVFVADALALLPTLPACAYDVVLAIDILEHFDAGDGLRFLDQLKRVAGRAALVSTPKEFVAQEVPANPLENHRSVWTREQLASIGFDRILPNDESWIATWQRAQDQRSAH